jgi:hypothetical protein
MHRSGCQSCDVHFEELPIACVELLTQHSLDHRAAAAGGTGKAERTGIDFCVSHESCLHFVVADDMARSNFDRCILSLLTNIAVYPTIRDQTNACRLSGAHLSSTAQRFNRLNRTSKE